MLKIFKFITWLSFSLILFSCGTEDSVSVDSEMTKTGIKDNSFVDDEVFLPNSEQNLALDDPQVVSGKRFYESQCMVCHGRTGESLLLPDITLSLGACETCGDHQTLTQKILTDMPPVNPGRCDSECAETTAAYILANYSTQSNSTENMASPEDDVNNSNQILDNSEENNSGDEQQAEQDTGDENNNIIASENGSGESNDSTDQDHSMIDEIDNMSSENQPNDNEVEPNENLGEPMTENDPEEVDNTDFVDIHNQTLNRLETQCSVCHGELSSSNNGLNLTSGSPEDFAARMVNQLATASGCEDERLIDFVNPENSLFLKLIDSNHSETECIAKMPLGTDGVSQVDFDLISEWVSNLITVYGENASDPDFVVDSGSEETDEFISSARAVPADGFEVLRRTKYLINGQAITGDEYNSALRSNGTLRDAQFESLVQSWMATDGFTQKRKAFFELLLQQDPADTNYVQQLRNTKTLSTSSYRRNLSEGMVRTAERIYQEGEDFRSIIWTNRHEVTTATLAVMKMLDNAPLVNKFGNFKKGNSWNDLKHFVAENYGGDDALKAADTSDWRTVELRYTPGSTEHNTLEELADGSVLNSVRSVPDGGFVNLRTPRTLCSTPAFFQKWITNQDNKFRAQINQCLIIALGDTFAAGDPTKLDMHPLPGVNYAEIPEGSDCMGCHKNLDVMKSAFEQHFDYDHTRFMPNSQSSVEHYREVSFSSEGGKRDDYEEHFPDYFAFPIPYFSYQGVNEQEEDLFSLLRTMATHEDSAIAWARKVCQWASSIRCDKQDPEIIRIANTFADSGYRLDRLFEAFFKSKLVTHTYSDSESTYPGAQVSIARRAHYCHAIKERLKAVRKSQGQDNITRDIDVCGINDVLTKGIPQGESLRGSVDFSLPVQNDAFSSISIANLCDESANEQAGKSHQTFDRRNGSAAEHIELMVTKLLGYPVQSPQYSEVSEGLMQTYHVFRASNVMCSSASEFERALTENTPSCGLGLSQDDAMKTVFSLVCQHPSLTSLGL